MSFNVGSQFAFSHTMQKMQKSSWRNIYPANWGEIDYKFLKWPPWAQLAIVCLYCADVWELPLPKQVMMRMVLFTFLEIVYCWVSFPCWLVGNRLMLVSTRVCNLQPPARQFPLMVFWSSLAPQTRCLLSCQLQLKPSSIPLSAYIMQREFSLRPGSITSWVWSKKKKQQKIPTVRDWNDAVSAYCGCCTTGAIVACFYKQLIHCGWTLHPGV